MAEAAEALGVSPRRVRALAEAGELPARRVGRAWVIDPDSQLPRRPPGRRLSARSAWAVLDLGHENFARSERKRARERQERLGDPGSRRSSGAEVHRLVAHPVALRRLEDDHRIIVGGVSAAAHHGADSPTANRQIAAGVLSWPHKKGPLTRTFQACLLTGVHSISGVVFVGGRPAG